MLQGTYYSTYPVSPILISGRKNLKPDGTDDGGHGWVIDGFIKYRLDYTNNGFMYDSEEDDILWHCVWGWHGSDNGYFYWAKNNRFDFDIIEKNRDDLVTNTYNFGYYANCNYMGCFIQQGK